MQVVALDLLKALDEVKGYTRSHEYLLHLVAAILNQKSALLSTASASAPIFANSQQEGEPWQRPQQVAFANCARQFGEVLARVRDYDSSFCLHLACPYISLTCPYISLIHDHKHHPYMYVCIYTCCLLQQPC